MDKFLFLDMDGVVNSVEYSVGHRPSSDGYMHDEADPVKLGLIRFICEQTDAKIVISSTWRIGRSVDWFLGYFERYGWIAPVVALTPDTCGTRGHDVETWLTTNNYNHPPHPYVILDDDSDFHPYQPLVLCNAVYGITLKEALDCVDKLGLGEKGDQKLIDDLRAHVDFKSQTDL